MTTISVTIYAMLLFLLMMVMQADCAIPGVRTLTRRLTLKGEAKKGSPEQCNEEKMREIASKHFLKVTDGDRSITVSPPFLTITVMNGDVVVLGKQMAAKLKKVCPKAEFPDHNEFRTFEDVCSECHFSIEKNPGNIPGQKLATIKLGENLFFPYGPYTKRCEEFFFELDQRVSICNLLKSG